MIPSLILASQSPRRRALLNAVGVSFDVLPAHADEAAVRAESPRALAMKTAMVKADAVAALVKARGEPAIIIAADTIVVLDGQILGKPRDRVEARVTLRDLSGRRHEVITGIVVQDLNGAAWIHAERSEVLFNTLSTELIDLYVQSGQADDKAGAYGVQEVGLQFIAEVRGDLTNVIGLPLACLRTGLEEITQKDIFNGRSLRAATLAAYPELAGLPPACLLGIPD